MKLQYAIEVKEGKRGMVGRILQTSKYNLFLSPFILSPPMGLDVALLYSEMVSTSIVGLTVLILSYYITNSRIGTDLLYQFVDKTGVHDFLSIVVEYTLQT